MSKNLRSSAKDIKKAKTTKSKKSVPSIYKQKMDEISNLLNSLFISPQDLKQINEMFSNIENEGNNIDPNNPNNEDSVQFHMLWNNFLENIQEYFNIPPQKRLEHFIKSYARQLYELMNSQDFGKLKENTSISNFYSLLDSLANKYQDDIEHTQDLLYQLQATLIQIKSSFEPFETKDQCGTIISRMIQATEEMDINEKNVKAVLQKISDYTNYFNQTFPSEATKEIEDEEESSSSPSSNWNQPNVDVQKENKIEHERKKLSDELNESLAEEQRLNTILDQIKAEIAATRLSYSKFQLNKTDMDVFSDRDSSNKELQTLQSEVQDLQNKIKDLERQKSEAIKRQKLDEDQHKYFAADASIYNETLRNSLRYIKQYESQVDLNNRDISAIIKEMKSTASGGIEGQTVSFSNHQLSDSLKEQQAIHKKLLDDKDLLIQQQEDFDLSKLLEVSCSSIFQEINNVNEKIDIVNKHQEMLKNENNALRVRKRIEEENIETRAKRLEVEINKWMQRIDEMKSYEIADVPKPALTTEIIYRNEFDEIQDFLDERKEVQMKYHKLKRNENSDPTEITKLKKRYGELTNKIADSGHKEVYENLIRLQTDLSLLRDAYRGALKESIDRRTSFVNMFAAVGDLETNICMALREIEKRGLNCDFDEELTDFIAGMFVDKLSKAAELKKVYDWLDENFDDPSVKQETKLMDKLNAALDFVRGPDSYSDV